MICLLLTGCLCPFRCATDEDLIDKLLKEWRAAIMTKNLDALMCLYSDNYQSAEHCDKEALHKFLQNLFDHGQLNDAKVDLAAAKVEIRDCVADAAGIEVAANFGDATVGFHLIKEGKAWKIDTMHTVLH